MQNSKLSTIIFPRLNDSWQRFIQRINKELEEMATSNRSEWKRMNELKLSIPQIKKAMNESSDNIKEILKYRDAFVMCDKNLSTLFDALEFFDSVNNLDNDAVVTIYNQIVNSPVILTMDEEYSSNVVKNETYRSRVKPLEEIIRGKKFNISLIKELLEKYKFDDKTKKDILFYILTISAVKQDNVKKTSTPRIDRKKEKERLQREKFKELCEEYDNKLDLYKDFLTYCYNLKQSMSITDENTYKGYISYSSSDLKDKYGFNDEELLKIYALALINYKNDIEEYIDSLSDLQMDDIDLANEISFLQVYLEEFDALAKKVSELAIKDEVEEEYPEDNTRVFFAHDPWQRLIVNPKLITINKNGLNAFIRKVNGSSSYKIDGVNANQMLGVDQAEKAIGKNIYILSATNYKLAYIKVKDCVLILGIADANDTKFDSTLNSIVKAGSEAIKRQIGIIESDDFRKDAYVELQKSLVGKLLKDENKTK